MQNVSIFKNNNKKKETEPDYTMSAKQGEAFVEVGACWIKDGAKGKYFSCQFKKPYQDKKGFQLVQYAEFSDSSKTEPTQKVDYQAMVNEVVPDDSVFTVTEDGEIPF